MIRKSIIMNSSRVLNQLTNNPRTGPIIGARGLSTTVSLTGAGEKRKSKVAPEGSKLGNSIGLISTFGLLHIENGMKEIMADYVHDVRTRNMVEVCMRVLLVVAAKDVVSSVLF